MGNKASSHWDYVWENHRGETIYGMLLFKPKSNFISLQKIKNLIKRASRTEQHVFVTVVHEQHIQRFCGKVTFYSEHNETFTFHDVNGEYYEVPYYNVTAVRRAKDV